MRSVLLAGVLALSAAAAVAQTQHYDVTVTKATPPQGFAKLNVKRAAVGATPIEIWSNAAINPDCTAMTPGSTLAVLTPPRHGAVAVSDEPIYMAFPPNNPRSACNNRKVPGHRAVYTAQAGFAGHDRLVLRGTSPAGGVREIDVAVDVR